MTYRPLFVEVDIEAIRRETDAPDRSAHWRDALFYMYRELYFRERYVFDRRSRTVRVTTCNGVRELTEEHIEALSGHRVCRSLDRIGPPITYVVRTGKR